MEQSYDRWGGKDVAWLLLITSPRSWYSEGTVDRSGGGYLVGLDVGAGMVADWRHVEWHSEFHPVMRPLTQSTWGLCFLSQGLPKTKGKRGEWRTRKTISSWWFARNADLYRPRGSLDLQRCPHKCARMHGWGRTDKTGIRSWIQQYWDLELGPLPCDASR